MVEIYLRKVGNIMLPAYHSQDDFDALPNNTVFKAIITIPRNYEFLKKFFSLIKCSYDLWEPIGQGEKSIETYRAELTILCGYYEQVFSVFGGFKVVPKSISFAKMTEETFSRLYSKAIDIILLNILPDKYTREELEAIIDKILRYDR